MHDAEVEVEAELLAGGKLRNILNMLELEGQSFLFLQRVLFLLISVQCLILSLVDIHAFEDV